MRNPKEKQLLGCVGVVIDLIAKNKTVNELSERHPILMGAVTIITILAIATLWIGLLMLLWCIIANLCGYGNSAPTFQDAMQARKLRY